MASALMDPDVRGVAFVRLRVGLGDLLCGAPALRAVRRARPDLRITLVTWAEMAPVVRRMRACVDELLPFPGHPGIPERPPRAEELPGFWRRAAERGFDLAVQSYGDNPVAGEVTERMGARLVAGFAVAGWRPPDPALGLAYPREAHEVWRHLRLVRRLGVPAAAGADALEFPSTPADHREYRGLCGRHGLRPGGYAVVHPGATCASRRWPADRFARVADALARRGLRVVLGGVPAERGLTAAVAGEMREPATDLAGRTTLGGYALLLRGARLLVGNDTGAAHLAAAVGAPSVTVFLSGDPVRWAHPGPRHRVARSDVGCSPCRHLTCPIDFRCASRVSVDDVVGHVEALIG
ncbi:ADP-heptose:LPS heptosyltransferase [Spinactinospora alkalitolerans]|uniref:ADP-heptose:LPS heptosyltransferase n=1 Tax=Spinactinospora alkalitolerans TaxID=687207 RepID=A0A852TRL5_9ACTN|nr:glycosyltransferase family 9 protein [Spinactinospora alkalitolerans]NYE47036.1 ADP-heptose:LPS heptosyltransferase [Spinactinospora alkalitolerans]